MRTIFLQTEKGYSRLWRARDRVQAGHCASGTYCRWWKIGHRKVLDRSVPRLSVSAGETGTRTSTHWVGNQKYLQFHKPYWRHKCNPISSACRGRGHVLILPGAKNSWSCARHIRHSGSRSSRRGGLYRS